MKKILSWILVILLSGFTVAFGASTYRYYQALHADDPIDPYLLVEEGTATITRGTLAIDMTKNETYDLSEGDVIITRESSLAVIHWPDHSTTRLGANSRLTIDRMRVTKDYSQIELVARLESGKAWSNIVRTLYPGSRVELRTPRGVVAGVRGTVFDINLDEDYIASISHSVSLSNALRQSVSLFQGEAVRASNIFEKISLQLNQTWYILNTTKDTVYDTLRTKTLEATQLSLQTRDGLLSLWDQFVKWVLSFFSAFRDISLIDALNKKNIDAVINFPQEQLEKWYQKYQNKDFVQERDLLRSALARTASGSQSLTDMLTRGALWDKLSFSGMTLDGANGLLTDYSKKAGITVDGLLQNIKKTDVNSMTEQGKQMIQGLFY